VNLGAVFDVLSFLVNEPVHHASDDDSTAQSTAGFDMQPVINEPTNEAIKLDRLRLDLVGLRLGRNVLWRTHGAGLRLGHCSKGNLSIRPICCCGMKIRFDGANWRLD